MSRLVEKLDAWMIGVYLYAAALKNDLKNDEHGVSSIVAAVLLILIVLLLVSIFWTNLKEWFTNTLWGRVTGSSLPE